MDDLAKQSPAERGTYFMQAATELGLTPSIIEKDFWVCWILKRLFNLECVENHLLFKGGTSLSKAYKLIRRFSEDIDLSIHRASLGFEGKKDPATPGLSNKLRNRMIEALGMEARAKIQNEIQPELKELIREQLGSDEWNLERDPTDPDGQSLAFAYPRTSLTPETSAYIRPAVKIEFGARSDHWPAESKTLKPYVAEALPDAMEQVEVIVKAMSTRRTFWEKATILHQMAHLPDHRQFPDRYSRHYADLAAMVEARVVSPEDDNEDKLLIAVVDHKMTFYRSGWANYKTAVRGSLILLPQENRVLELSRDLDSMREMFFDESPKPETVFESLRNWEKHFNR